MCGVLYSSCVTYSISSVYSIRAQYLRHHLKNFVIKKPQDLFWVFIHKTFSLHFFPFLAIQFPGEIPSTISREQEKNLFWRRPRLQLDFAVGEKKGKKARLEKSIMPLTAPTYVGKVQIVYFVYFTWYIILCIT